MLKKLILTITLLLGLITFAQSETSWIKKKDKSEKIEKKEQKTTSSWIKKKIKENKKEYKKEEKKITKEVKSWIKKKSKDKYIASIKDLPNGAIYFHAANASKSSIIYGYVLPDTSSKLINNYYETSKGFAYFNDGKTTCKVGSTVRFVSSSGEVMSRISGECTNGIKFTGQTTQEGNLGSGSAKTADGKERYFVDVHTEKIEIAKLHKKNESFQKFALANETQEKIELKPTGKYYALLIGNSKYKNWTSLVSPKNDVKEIDRVLNSQYNFEKVITIIDGTEKDIMKGFKKLSKITTDKDYVLIYYSGHGDNRGASNYWIPVDGEKDYGLGDWINTAEIQNYIMDEIPNHHIVLMSDSCYFDVRTKGMSEPDKRKSMAYTKLLKRRAIIIAQSGSNEPVLDSSDDKHSMYGKSFINSLKNNEGIIRMTDIFEEIYLSHSGMRQQPQWGRVKGWGDTGGDFLFIAKR